MMRPAVITVAMLSCVGLAPASAAPATPEEAQRLTALFERYVGSGSDPLGAVVTVTPHGESYTARFDLDRLVGRITRAFGETASGLTAGPLVIEMAPQPDARWHVTMDGFPPIGFAQGQHAFSVLLNSYAFDGVFDPALHAFASSTVRTTGATTRADTPRGPLVTRLTDSGLSTSHAQAAGEGLIDTTGDATLKDLAYSLADSAGADSSGKQAPAWLSARIAGITVRSSMTRQPIVALEDLWQFVVAHPSRVALAGEQAAFKAHLRAIVPLSATSTTDLAFAGIAVQSRLGTFAADALTVHVDDSSPQAAGGLFTRLTWAGFVPPADLVPTWAAGLVPTSADLGEGTGPFDSRAGLLKLIDALDLSADKPLTDAQQADIAAAFRSADQRVVIAPSSITTPTVSVRLQGTVHVTSAAPTGDVTVRATGLDKAIDTVRAAAHGDPNAGQAVLALMAAKATAKAEGPDSYVWQIAGDAAGFTVNGMPLGAMPGLMPGSGTGGAPGGKQPTTGP